MGSHRVGTTERLSTRHSTGFEFARTTWRRSTSISGREESTHSSHGGAPWPRRAPCSRSPTVSTKDGDLQGLGRHTCWRLPPPLCPEKGPRGLDDGEGGQARPGEKWWQPACLSGPSHSILLGSHPRIRCSPSVQTPGNLQQQWEGSCPSHWGESLPHRASKLINAQVLRHCWA